MVKAYIPNDKLTYTYLSNWSGLPDTPDNYLVITYAVEQSSEGTLLSITQTNYDAEKAAHSMENWKQLMDGLKKLVE
ncbi:MAG: SRPBCC domain-containing protein [Saprospiraceae bacterium]|nr:SRPBCC domain-containing protein [Saprospiraceae bacterium]